MPLFQTFMVVHSSSEKGEKRLRAKTIDLTAVESWEFVSESYTKVFMISGDKFIIKFSILEFGDLVMSTVDSYGVLFEFNLN